MSLKLLTAKSTPPLLNSSHKTIDMFQNLFYIFRHTQTSLTKVAFWEILHGFLIAAPSGLLLIIIWELFEPSPDQQKIWLQIGSMTFLFIVQMIVSRKTMVHSNVSIYNMCAKVRIQLGNHLQKLSLGFYKKNDPGDLASVVLQDVNNFENIFAHTVQSIFGAIFGTLFLSVFLLYLDWKLALLMLGAIPAAFLFVFIAGKVSQRSNEQYIQSRNNTSSRFIEYILGINHLKAFNQTGTSFTNLKDAFDQLRKNSIRMELIPGPFILTTFVVIEVFFLWMVYNGISRYNEQTLTVPVLVAFLIIGYRLYEPLKLIIVDYAMLKYMNVSLQRIINLLESPLQSFDQEQQPTAYDIHFQHVTFSYLDREILKNVSFSMPNGGITALVGASGSGKTTIANLITRFWDVQQGTISIGGVDVQKIAPQIVYGLISEVFQDVYLFDDSVLNNIKIGNPNATQKEIDEVIEKSKVSEFLDQLPNGINTLVGEGGSHLSGGQKQRISIARAMLKDAPIVLLDEATASLDPENEIYIQQAIQELVANKTVVVIAHKLQTIKHADKILVLDNGQIKEEGTHDQLIELGGQYAHFWHTQQTSKGWKIAG